MKTCLVCVILLLVACFIMPAFADLDDGLVLHYPFDEDEGATVTDQSGNGNNGVNNGATFTPNGAVGGAYQFDGNDYINMGNLAILENQYALSFGAWAYPTATSLDAVMGQTGYLDENIELLVRVSENRVHGAVWAQDSSLRDAPHNGLVVNSEWQHLFCTYDGTQFKTYHNGRLIASSAVFPSQPSADNDALAAVGDICVGRGWEFHGMIDDVRIYNRVLASNEVYALYASANAADGPFIGVVGFSDAPDGDQDVTEFLNDETLHIYVKDVDLDPADPKCTVAVTVFQKKKWSDAKKSRKVRLYLDPQEDGSYTGAVPLNPFGVGMVEVQVLGNRKKGKEKFHRTGYIFINPAAP